MRSIDAGEFLDLLRRSNLLPLERWAEVERELHAFRRGRNQPEPRELAKHLVSRSWLTGWQAEMLLAGRNAFFLGRYRLLECIGTGGMGAVFKARHDRMGRTVAIKEMSEKIVRDDRAVARFRQEIQAAAALNHPNIVAAYDAACERGVHFLVMEYVPGRDLGWYVYHQKRLPIGWVCECIRQAALGLQHAHEQGMVHRDIKPTNLLIAEDADTGRPITKILDMGLARFASETDVESSPEKGPVPGDASLTQAGQVLGTPDYMAPEQARDTRRADARSDIFSLGCTLFRALTGELPFAGESIAEKLSARQRGFARQLRPLRLDAPEALEGILTKMLARAPDDRYQTAAEVAQALAPFAMPVPIRVTGASAGTGPTARTSVTANPLPFEDPRFAQFLSQLATHAGDETPHETRSAGSLWKERLARVPRQMWLAGGAALLTIAFVVVVWRWLTEATLVVEWPVADRDQATLTINDRVYDLEQESLRTSGRPGRWSIQIERKGYEPIRQTVELRSGQHFVWEPAWRARPETIRRRELSTLRKVAESAANLRYPDEPLPQLRSDLLAFFQRWPATEEGSAAARLLAGLPAPADRLNPLQLAPEQRRAAGLGDPARMPPNLVAVLGDFRLRFWNRVLSVAVSADGALVAGASLDGTVQVFDASTGEVRQTLSLSNPPQEVRFSPQGHTLIVVGTGRDATIWDADSGELRFTLQGAALPIAISHDGKRLAARDRRHDIEIWDLTQGRSLRWLRNPARGILRSLAFHPSGELLAASLGDDSVHVWQVESEGEPRKLADAHAPCFSKDGLLLATSTRGGDIQLWDAASGEFRLSLERGGFPLFFSADSTRLFTQQPQRRRVLVWDVHASVIERTLVDVPLAVTASADSRWLAAIDEKAGHLRRWEVATGALREVPLARGASSALAFSPDGHSLLAGDGERIRLWNPAEMEAIRSGERSWRAAALAPAGDRLAAFNGDQVKLLDLSGEAPPRDLSGEVPELERLAFSPDGRWLAGSGGYDFFKVALPWWDVASGREEKHQAEQSGVVRILAWSGDGKRLVTGGDTSRVLVWDTATRTIFSTIDDLAERPTALALDLQGRWLAAGQSEAVVLRDWKSAQQRRLELPPRTVVKQLAFGPGGRRLAGLTAQGLLLWNSVNGERLGELVPPTSGTELTAFRFNLTGDRVAIAGSSGKVWLYDVSSSGPLPLEAVETLPLGPDRGLVRDLFWSCDGRHLITLNGNGTIYVLRIGKRETAR